MADQETKINLEWTILLVLCGLAVLAIGYYFLIELPRPNSALLDLERQKFEVAKKEKEAAEEEKKAKAEAEGRAKARAEQQDQEKQTKLEKYIDDADDVYWQHVKLNGQPVEGKPGTYTAPRWVWDDADKKKKTIIDACYKKYR